MKGTGLGSPCPGTTTLAPKVIGVDPSLRSTGIACSLGWTDRIAPPTGVSGGDRLDLIEAAVTDACQDAVLVVIEGPSYGSARRRQRGHHERAGLWWLIHQRLYRRVPVAVCPPAVLKRYATGRGNAAKPDVLAAVQHDFPTFEAGGHDEADAIILAAIGAHRLGHPLINTSADHHQALDSVEWPLLLEEAA